MDGFRYVLDGPDPEDLFRPLQITEGHQYFALKLKSTKHGDIQRCSCRQLIGYAEAMDLLQNGNAKAIWELNKKHERMELYQREKSIKDRDGNPTGATVIETHIWRAQQTKVPRIDLVSQADIERAYIDLNPTFIRYIEECHKLFMGNRAKLIVPFRDDPTEGRLLFPFPPDDRTPGGH